MSGEGLIFAVSEHGQELIIDWELLSGLAYGLLDKVLDDLHGSVLESRGLVSTLLLGAGDDLQDLLFLAGGTLLALDLL